MIDPKQNLSFCPAAWNSIYVHTDGAIRNCCIAKENLGTVDQEITTTLSGQKNIQIKKQMLSGDKVASCQQCWPENQGTLRDLFLHNYYTADRPTEYESADFFRLQYLDLRWRNTCNFACVYCGPEVSSAWAAELGVESRMLSDKIGHVQNYIDNNLDHVDHIYLAGGEPLMIKENVQLLEKMATINTDIRIVVNSNVSQANDKNLVYQLLKKFPNTQWSISAEDIGNRFDYIRYGGHWNEFVQSVNKIRQDFGTEKVQFNLVLCTLNALSLWNFADWVIEQGFVAEMINISLINQGARPDQPLDPRALGQKFVQDTLKLAGATRYQKINGLNQVTKILSTPYNQTNVPAFLQYISQLDKKRNLNARSTFPDVFKYIDNIS